MRRMTKSNEAKWRRLVAAQARSGQSVPGFAAAQGVAASTLYWWRSRLRRNGLELVPVELVEEKPAIEVERPAHCDFMLEIEGSLTLRIPPGFDEAELRRLLRAVRC